MAYDQTPMTTPYRTPSNPELTLPNTEPNKIFRTHLTALFYALLIVSVSPTYAADDVQPAQPTKIASGEASTAMARGKEALAVRDYETAFAEYRAALGQEPDKSASSPLRELALAGFTQAGMRLAEQRIAEGRWQDAEDTVRTILQPEYNPGDKSAQKLLNQLEDPWYFNKTITPEFVYQVEEVKHLLNVADGLSDSGRYDDAKETLDSVLEKDPYNEAAWRGIEKINKAKRRVADIAREAHAPLRSEHNTARPNDWLPWGLLGALVLTSVVLVLRGVFGSNASQNGKAEASALLPLGWFLLAVSVLVFAVIAIRYQIVFTPNQNGQNVLKVDRWTGSVEWLGD
jgi:tetratricopeptide (TPR) repeat protein